MTRWVLLRGLTREAGHWGDFTRQLGDRLESENAVLALDLPGNGALHAVDSPANVPAMAAACRDRLATMGARPPYVLVAMSLGAMVALQWAHRFAPEVAGCVLINTSLRGRSAFWERLRPHNYLRLCRLLLPGRSPSEREREVLAMTSARPQDHSAALLRWTAIARERPVSRVNALRQLAAAARYSAPASRPAVPMLVLASSCDSLVSPRCSERLAAQWELPLRLHPDAGHDLPLDDPEWVVQQVVEWWHARPDLSPQAEDVTKSTSKCHGRVIQPHHTGLIDLRSPE
jgi:pimeloyl-ACP methyl ester carboxylesterase